MRNKKTLFLVNHEVCFVIFVNRIVHWFTEHPVITDYELDSAGGSGGGHRVLEIWEGHQHGLLWGELWCRVSPQCALCVLTSAGCMGACELYLEDERGTQYEDWEIYLILPNFWNFRCTEFLLLQDEILVKNRWRNRTYIRVKAIWSNSYFRMYECLDLGTAPHV